MLSGVWVGAGGISDERGASVNCGAGKAGGGGGLPANGAGIMPGMGHALAIVTVRSKPLEGAKPLGGVKPVGAGIRADSVFTP